MSLNEPSDRERDDPYGGEDHEDCGTGSPEMTPAVGNRKSSPCREEQGRDQRHPEHSSQAELRRSHHPIIPAPDLFAAEIPALLDFRRSTKEFAAAIPAGQNASNWSIRPRHARSSRACATGRPCVVLLSR